MNMSDQPDVLDNPRSSRSTGPGSKVPSPRQLQEQIVTEPTPRLMGVMPNKGTKAAVHDVASQLFPSDPSTATVAESSTPGEQLWNELQLHIRSRVGRG